MLINFVLSNSLGVLYKSSILKAGVYWVTGMPLWLWRNCHQFFVQNAAVVCAFWNVNLTFILGDDILQILLQSSNAVTPIQCLIFLKFPKLAFKYWLSLTPHINWTVKVFEHLSVDINFLLKKGRRRRKKRQTEKERKKKWKQWIGSCQMSIATQFKNI